MGGGEEDDPVRARLHALLSSEILEFGLVLLAPEDEDEAVAVMTGDAPPGPRVLGSGTPDRGAGSRSPAYWNPWKVKRGLNVSGPPPFAT